MSARYAGSAERLRFRANTSLKIVIPFDEPSIEQLQVDVVVGLKRCFSLTFAEPDPVVVSAAPALDVPTESAVAPLWLILEDIEQKIRKLLLVVDRIRPVLRRQIGRRSLL